MYEMQNQFLIGALLCLQPVRGKKTKAAKAKAKYADQDEEDRELAMQFLGSAGKLTAPLLCSPLTSPGVVGSTPTPQSQFLVWSQHTESSVACSNEWHHEICMARRVLLNVVSFTA